MRIFKKREPVEQMYTEAQLRERVKVMIRASVDAMDAAVKDVAPDRYQAFVERVDWYLHQAGAKEIADRAKMQAVAAKARADAESG